MSAMVGDRDAAEQLIIDLTDRGIDRTRVRTRPSGERPDTHRSSRATGEQDTEFTEQTGKGLGTGWLIGAVIGVIVSVIATSILIAPPWQSGLAAAITIGVALGSAWLFGGLGLLQGGIARAGETPAGQETRPELLGHDVVVEVDARTPQEQEAAEAVFRAHRADRVD